MGVIVKDKLTVEEWNKQKALLDVAILNCSEKSDETKENLEKKIKVLTEENSTLRSSISSLNSTLNRQTDEIEKHFKEQNALLSLQLQQAVSSHLKVYDSKESEMYSAVESLGREFETLLNNQNALNETLIRHEEILSSIADILELSEEEEVQQRSEKELEKIEQLTHSVEILTNSLSDYKEHTNSSLSALQTRLDALTPSVIAQRIKTQLNT